MSISVTILAHNLLMVEELATDRSAHRWRSSLCSFSIRCAVSFSHRTLPSSSITRSSFGCTSGEALPGVVIFLWVNWAALFIPGRLSSGLQRIFPIWSWAWIKNFSLVDLIFRPSHDYVSRCHPKYKRRAWIERFKCLYEWRSCPNV